MGVPLVYRKASDINAVYNYTDVADGTGVVIFKAFTSTNNSATSYWLGGQTLYSSNTSLNSTTDTTYNFDSSVLNAPRTVKGTAFIKIMTEATTSSSIVVSYAITLQKVDALGVATDISTTSTMNISKSGAGQSFLSMLHAVTLTQTNIKKGEKIRLKIAVTSASWTGNSHFGCDPVNRGTDATFGTTYSITLDAYIPFRIDI